MTHPQYGKPETIPCYRCGRPGYTNWCDVTRMGDAEPTFIPGEQYCLTPGCTDEDGSRRLTPLTPADLRHRADRAWMRRHERLVSE